MNSDILGDWVVMSGSADVPQRRIGLSADNSIYGFHEQEKFWHCDGSLLYLLDANRSVISFFEISGLPAGLLKGRVRNLSFTDSAIWLKRYQAALADMGTNDTGDLPIQVGPLETQVHDADAFRHAWEKREDFSVVLFPGGHVKTRPPLSASRNLGTTPESKKFETSVNVGAPNGHFFRPAFFHVLHDCLLVDGNLVATRDRRVIHETTQIAGMGPLWDTDFGLDGSVINAHQQLVKISRQEPTLTLDMDLFLFSAVRYGYGHWLGQSVVNAVFVDWLATAAPQLASSMVMAVNCGLDRESFRSDCFKLLGFKNPILPIPRGVVRVKRLIVPSFHRCHSDHWPGIGSVFRRMGENALRLRPNVPRVDRIYSSRRGQNRGFTDDAGIAAITRKHNFTEIVGGSIPYVDQVAAYAGARAVFGIFGSNMCNISFCPPEAVVMESFDELCVDPFWDFFLANAGGLNFCYLITEVDEKQRAISYHERTTDLNPDLLDEVFSAVLPK